MFSYEEKTKMLYKQYPIKNSIHKQTVPNKKSRCLVHDSSPILFISLVMLFTLLVL
jgi:TFIIF-interacting CTD phosphatase-like protein